jgi:flagellar biosynthetic protein FliR
MTAGFAIYVGLVLARVAAFVAVAPPFAGRTPRLVRAGMAIALTAFYVSEVGPDWHRLPAVDPLVYALALAREALIGAAMGFAFGLFLLPARLAGEFVTLQVGLNVSPHVGPTGTDSAGAMTNIFETGAALLFLIVDAHHVVLAAFHGSLSVLPLGGQNIPQAGPMIDGLTSAYQMGVLLAGPLVLCLFLLAVMLAVMARAAPQLNVYSIGFTLQVLVVLFAGLFLLPDMVMTMQAFIAKTGDVMPKLLGG